VRLFKTRISSSDPLKVLAPRIWEASFDARSRELVQRSGVRDGKIRESRKSPGWSPEEAPKLLLREIERKLENGFNGELPSWAANVEVLPKGSEHFEQVQKSAESQREASHFVEPLETKLELTLRKNEKIWILAYDPKKQLVRRKLGSGKSSSNKMKNSNEAAHFVARHAKEKIDSGFEPVSDVPKWIIGYSKRVNENVNTIESTNDGSDLMIFLTKDGRFWSVQVDGSSATRSWGTIRGKRTSSRRKYSEGKAGRTPNQQARLEAMKDAQKKIDAGYSDVSLSNDFDSVESSDEDVVPNPMLASSWNPEQTLKFEQFYAQPKLDGLRCMANLETGELWSRSRKRIETLQHIARRIEGTQIRDLKWVDGEVYVHGLSIQALNSIVRSGVSSSEDRERVEFHVFDAIVDKPFSERLDLLKIWISSGDIGDKVKLTETRLEDAVKLDGIHHEMIERGYEGVMVRLNDSTKYAKGRRSRSLQKVKAFRREEFPCIDIIPQKLQAGPDLVGSFVLTLPDGSKTFKATPKCTIEEKEEMWRHRELYKSGSYTAIVQFFDLSSDGVPRFPVLLGFRHKDDS